jgi:PAS domain S-box-containing protein
MAESDVRQLEGRIRELQAECHRLEKQVSYWKNLYNEGEKHWEANSSSRERLADLLELLPVLYWAINCEGHVLQFQGAGCRMLGIGGGNVYGSSILDVFGENPKLAQAVNRALSGETFSQQIPLGEFHLDCHFLPQWNAEKDVVGVRGVGMLLRSSGASIEESPVSTLPAPRIPLGEPLHPLEGPLHDWLKSLPDFVLSVVRDGTIRFINRTIPPLSIKQVVGSNIYDYFSPDRREDMKRMMEHAFTTGETVDYETEANDPDGVTRIYSCRLGPFKPAGEVLAVMVLARDVTEIRRMEDLARKRQNELEHLTRVSTMGEMAAILSHCLNNPLAAIANYAHGCIRWMKAGDVDKARFMEAQTEIVEQCNRSSDYIRQLRSFLQKREIRHVETDLTDVLIDAIRLTEPEFRANDLAVRTEMKESRLRVIADPLQIEQVLVNLLLNAVEAMKPLQHETAEPSRGKESERPREVLVRVEPNSAKEVLISVVDIGRGLSPGFEEKVFEPFFTTKQKSLGMGLSVSRSIVESHGGRLEVMPNAGPGTTFRFTLPRYTGSQFHE